jgi:hypothetical protein
MNVNYLKFEALFLYLFDLKFFFGVYRNFFLRTKKMIRFLIEIRKIEYEKNFYDQLLTIWVSSKLAILTLVLLNHNWLTRLLIQITKSHFNYFHIHRRLDIQIQLAVIVVVVVNIARCILLLDA